MTSGIWKQRSPTRPGNLSNPDQVRRSCFLPHDRCGETTSLAWGIRSNAKAVQPYPGNIVTSPKNLDLTRTCRDLGGGFFARRHTAKYSHTFPVPGNRDNDSMFVSGANPRGRSGTLPSFVFKTKIRMLQASRLNLFVVGNRCAFVAIMLKNNFRPGCLLPFSWQVWKRPQYQCSLQPDYILKTTCVQPENNMCRVQPMRLQNTETQ